MSILEEVEALKTVPLFSSLDHAQLKLIAFTSAIIEFQEGDVIFEEGEIGDEAYIILEGEAAIQVKSENGSKKIIAKVKPFDFIGEVAILCDIPRIATVLADTHVRAMKITKDSFFQLIKEFPEMSVHVMKELALRLNELMKRQA